MSFVQEYFARYNYKHIFYFFKEANEYQLISDIINFKKLTKIKLSKNEDFYKYIYSFIIEHSCCLQNIVLIISETCFDSILL